MANCLNPYLLNVGIRRDKSLRISSETLKAIPELVHVDLANKKNGYILAPCGKCFHCRQNRVRDWSIRTVHEFSKPEYRKTFMYFLTLTYDEKHIDDNSLDYRHVQLFLKKLRKYYSNDKLKFLCVGEYGFTSGRMHWHIIIFGFPKLVNYRLFHKLWQYGNVDADLVRSYSAIAYMLKYSFKDYKINKLDYISEGRTPPMFRCSQGFGKDFIEKNYKQVISDGFISYGKYRYRIPRYYREIYYRLCKVDGWREFDENFNRLQVKMLEDLALICDTGIVEFEADDKSFYDLYLKKYRPIWDALNKKLYENYFRKFKEKV